MCLHDYYTIRRTKTGIVERCTFCKKRNVVRISQNGRIDNRAYRAEHIRDIAQPFGRTKKIFKRVYGEADIPDAPKSKEQIHEEWQQTREEAIRFDEKLKRRFVE